MKEIATFARSSLDITKPLLLHGLRFSKVTSKQEWMNRTYNNTGLPKYPSTKEDLLNIRDPSNFCFSEAMDIDAINAETSRLLLDVIKASVNF